MKIKLNILFKMKPLTIWYKCEAETLKSAENIHVCVCIEGHSASAKIKDKHN